MQRIWVNIFAFAWMNRGRNLELNQPVYQKLNNAISKVADRKNFTYILDLSNGAVAFHSVRIPTIWCW